VDAVASVCQNARFVSRAVASQGIMTNKVVGLQAARAIAALAVAYFHSKMMLAGFPGVQTDCMPFLTEYGYLGVNFFFAISGYVICIVTSRADFTVTGFAIKRVFRLWPVYLAVLAVTIFLKRAYSLSELGFVGYSATLLPLREMPFLPVSWSLEHEVVFYALVALIVPLARAWGLAAVLAGLGVWAYLAPTSVWDWHLIAAPHVDFMAGVLAYLARPLTSRVGSVAPAIASAACLYALIAGSVPFSMAAASFFALTALINARLPWDEWPLRGLVALGDASYSIYLTHWALFLMAARFARMVGMPAWMAEPWRYTVLATSCALSVLLWHRIEKPCIALGNRLARRFAERPPATRVAIEAN
jgi:exopolysaccharide production protein ExoZ